MNNRTLLKGKRSFLKTLLPRLAVWVILVTTLPLSANPFKSPSPVQVVSTCVTSTATSGLYTGTVCIDSPDNLSMVSGQTTISLNFANGVLTPPVNGNTFTPAKATSPGVGSPLIVAAVGDSASGETNVSNVVSLIASWNPNLFLYLGDVYEEGSYTEFINWYGQGGSFLDRFRAAV